MYIFPPPFLQPLLQPLAPLLQPLAPLLQPLAPRIWEYLLRAKPFGSLAARGEGEQGEEEGGYNIIIAEPLLLP